MAINTPYDKKVKNTIFIYRGNLKPYIHIIVDKNMADKKRVKIRYAELDVSQEGFVSRLIGVKKSPDFSDVQLLRNILSKEKARILHLLKTKKPKSIYELSKMLERDFKSVRKDIRILERFGFIEFHSSKTGRRKSLMPVLIVDKLQIIINI